MEVLMPKGWAPPIGYANGIAANPGRMVFVAGQVGWDERQQFHSADLVPQFQQALKNVLAVLAAAGGKPEHVCRITAYCCDKPAYLAARPQLGRVWRELMGKHFPAMSMIFVADLLDHPGKIELEATAIVPSLRPRAPTRRAAPARGRRAARPGRKPVTPRRRRNKPRNGAAVRRSRAQGHDRQPNAARRAGRPER